MSLACPSNDSHGYSHGKIVSPVILDGTPLILNTDKHKSKSTLSIRDAKFVKSFFVMSRDSIKCTFEKITIDDVCGIKISGYDTKDVFDENYISGQFELSGVIMDQVPFSYIHNTYAEQLYMMLADIEETTNSKFSDINVEIIRRHGLFVVVTFSHSGYARDCKAKVMLKRVDDQRYDMCRVQDCLKKLHSKIEDRDAKYTEMYDELSGKLNIERENNRRLEKIIKEKERDMHDLADDVKVTRELVMATIAKLSKGIVNRDHELDKIRDENKKLKANIKRIVNAANNNRRIVNRARGATKKPDVKTSDGKDSDGKDSDGKASDATIQLAEKFGYSLGQEIRKNLIKKMPAASLKRLSDTNKMP